MPGNERVADRALLKSRRDLARDFAAHCFCAVVSSSPAEAHYVHASA